MKSLVEVSTAEVIRIVARTVSMRFENAGQVVAAVEMHHDARGIAFIRLVMFDTMEEAQAYSTKAGGVAPPAKATVLSLVTPKPEAAPTPKAELAVCGECIDPMGCRAVGDCALRIARAAGQKAKTEEPAT